MKIVIAKGNNHYETFFQLGKKLKKKIRYRNEFRRKKIGANYNLLCKKALEWYELVKKIFPEYYSEIKGLEEGSESRKGEIFLANCSDIFDIKEESEETKCTTLISKIKNNVYLCHNEDESYSDYIKDAYIFDLQIKNKRYFGFGTARAIMGSSISSSHNLIQCVNTLLPNNVKPGIPRNIISRMILDCKNEKEIKEKIKKIPRASTYHHTIIFLKENKFFSLEYDNKEILIKLINKFPFFHTNHYLSKLKKENNYKSKSSLIRYKNIKLLSKNINSEDDLYKTMSNSKNFPYGISKPETIYSVIINLNSKKIKYSFGKPTGKESYKNKLILPF